MLLDPAVLPWQSDLPRPATSAAQLRDVLGGRTLLALHDVELDALAFGEGLEATALDGRVVDEAVLLAVLGRDETKALRVIEPLHFAGRTHSVPLIKKLLFGVR